MALADAGATISLISTGLAEQLNLAIRKSYINATGVTNDSLNIIGQAAASINLAGRLIRDQTLYVADGISRHVILGTDFLSRLGEVTYNYNNCTLRVDRGPSVPMGENAIRSTVMLVEDLHVPPFCEMAVLAKTSSPMELVNCIFEGSREVTSPLLIGKSISCVKEGRLRIPIVNATAKIHILGKNSVVGSVETLEDDLKMISIPTKKDIDREPTPEKKLPSMGIKLSDTNLDPGQFEILQDLVDEFADITGEGIADLGRTTIVEHVVETLPGTTPIKSRPYNIPVGVRAEIKQQIDLMLEKGLISPSTGEWTSPVVLVKKKDGNWRFCVDYRKLNAVTKPTNMAISSIESAMEIMHGKQYFSSIDLCSGFFQVSLHKDSRPKSGFITPFGCYEFNALPQGMKGSPACFTKLAMALNSDLIASGKSACYLDDWIMTSHTFEEHMSLLRTVFSRLRYAGLKYRPSKSQLCRKELLYLGHIISRDGIAVAPHNTDKIKKFPRPKNRTEVKRLLGLFGYYRTFIKGFAAITSPITKLTSQSVEIRWNQECEEASENLRSQITSAPILAFPDFSRPFILSTDASAIAIGAVLSQIQQDDREHPISFYSKTLNTTERKWDACEQELYAIVTAVKHYKSFLMNNQFEVRTDNAACTYVLKKPDLSPKLSRWAIQLADYDFTIIHKSGRTNTVADALSRAEVTAIDGEDNTKPRNPNEEDMKTDQKRDYYLGPIWRYMVKDRFPKDATKADRKRIKSESFKFTVKHGVLYRQRDLRRMLAIPANQRQVLLYAVHDNIDAMHPGVNKTYQRLKDYYWFPRMYAEVENYVRQCYSCQTRKNPAGITRVPLGTFMAKGPYEVLSMDFMGPFVESEKGYKHILVFTDHFTKWCTIIPTKDQLAKTVADAYIERVFCVFGASKVLLSDRGKNFMSNLMAEVNKVLNVERKFTTPYHPQCNGQVEIYNKTIANMLSHFTEPKTQKDWATYLPFVQLAINSAKHTGLEASPSSLLLSREIRLPYDLTKPLPDHPADNYSYVEDIHRRMAEAWEVARENISRSKETQKRYYDKKSKPSTLKIGDYVMKYNKRGYPNLTSKLIHRWRGIYVIKDINETNASIQLYNKPDDEWEKVHLNMLKRYHGPLIRGVDSDILLDLDSPVEGDEEPSDEDPPPSRGPRNSSDERVSAQYWPAEEDDSPPVETVLLRRCGGALTPEEYAEIYKDRLKPGTIFPSSDYLRQAVNREVTPPPRFIRKGDVSEDTCDDFLHERNSPCPEEHLSSNMGAQAEASQPVRPPIARRTRLSNEQQYNETADARERPEVPARANTKYNLRKRPKANKHKDYLYQSDE